MYDFLAEAKVHAVEPIMKRLVGEGPEGNLRI